MSIHADLEADLKWREEELASLKRQVFIATTGSVAETTLLRALCAMLYAHYEGFCKYAWDLYLEYLGRMGIKREDCKPEIAALSMKSELTNLRDIPLMELWSFCETGYGDLLKEDLKFNERFVTSNLMPNMLRDHCKKVLLPHHILDENDATVRSMIGRRHEIAHGKKNMIRSLAEYDPYHKAALLVMHQLALEIVDAVDNKTYLK